MDQKYSKAKKSSPQCLVIKGKNGDVGRVWTPEVDVLMGCEAPHWEGLGDQAACWAESQPGLSGAVANSSQQRGSLVAWGRLLHC